MINVVMNFSRFDFFVLLSFLMILFLIKIHFIQLYFIRPILNTDCLYFDNQFVNTTKACRINRADEINENSYQECLNCYIEDRYIKLIHSTNENQCQRVFECIELKFLNNFVFEQFFRQYFDYLNGLFKISHHAYLRNSLYIKIMQDNYQKLHLDDLLSILKSNGKDYSYLSFSLYNHRKQILVDLETHSSNRTLQSIRIEIVCNETTKSIYELTRDFTPVLQPKNCIITDDQNSSRNHSTTIRTSTTDLMVKTNLLLFIGGLVIFWIWILCICICLYLRYYKWKGNDNLNQRSSLVSSMFSIDSVDDRLLSEQKQIMPKQIGHVSLYSYEHDF